MGRTKTNWTVDDIVKLMIACTSCMCLLILVVGIMIGVAMGKVDVAMLGKIQGAGTAGGLLGVLWILYLIIKRTITTGKASKKRIEAT